MLGRTADGVYWVFRYIERAENMARLVEAGLRVSLTRAGGGTRGGGASDDWASVLTSTEIKEGYLKHYDSINGPDVVDFMLRNKENSSSVASCLDAARNNARMVRTALTRETWEAVNESWIELQQLLARRIFQQDLLRVLDIIKRCAGLIRGAFHGTMLRNDIYNFARIGTFIERADNTARILDVKYYILLPSIDDVGSPMDINQWESILRSVSGNRAFKWAYGAQYFPRDIAEFLIKNEQVPRSLLYCIEKTYANMAMLVSQYGESNKAFETVGNMRDILRNRSVDMMIENGLHEFLDLFLEENNRLGEQIAEVYRFY